MSTQITIIFLSRNIYHTNLYDEKTENALNQRSPWFLTHFSFAIYVHPVATNLIILRRNISKRIQRDVLRYKNTVRFLVKQYIIGLKFLALFSETNRDRRAGELINISSSLRIGRIWLTP